MVQGQPYKGFQKKSPIYQFPLFIFNQLLRANHDNNRLINKNNYFIVQCLFFFFKKILKKKQHWILCKFVGPKQHLLTQSMYKQHYISFKNMFCMPPMELLKRYKKSYYNHQNKKGLMVAQLSSIFDPMSST